MRLPSRSAGCPHMWEVTFLEAAEHQQVAPTRGRLTEDGILSDSLIVQEDWIQAVAALLNTSSLQRQAPSMPQGDWTTASRRQFR